MSEASEEIVTETLEVVENITEAVKNGTGKVPATPEGMAIAYGSLVIMALLPIFFGSFRSIKHHADQKENCEKTGEKPERMTQKDAAMFPIIASCALFGIYIVFKIFSKEYINLLLTGYFFLLGVLALTHLISTHVSRLLPSSVPLIQYHLKLTQDVGEDLIDFKFSTHDLVSLAISTVIGVWYLVKKHWIANNIFGLAFSVNGVEMLHLNNVLTGCILLGGLFIYDIFWVFATDVMVTVARSFEAPIKIVFPQDLLEKGLAADNFAMLGLGDIVIPGIFIALLLRFDVSLKRGSQVYFYVTFAAYFAGLMTTIFIMHVYKHAQPALLYLVPACLGTPLLAALVRGDIKTMFKYEDHPEEPETADDKKADATDTKKTE
ncbi:Minor histocompatibility antigen H13 [Amphibalanus amphitrite]|uniref:Minor histocompatibility antigen H13 n=1 Tax=Amphibalanus amphitrite TaxID=1232801 RepID=A0A6A4VF06_AMPAM|nr:Minor histocompatibility antigen H13 [Amphibalanus amphitrite]